jgi:hypothetical protein
MILDSDCFKSAKSKNDFVYVGEKFERQMLSGELDVELTLKEH